MYSIYHVSQYKRAINRSYLQPLSAANLNRVSKLAPQIRRYAFERGGKGAGKHDKQYEPYRRGGQGRTT